MSQNELCDRINRLLLEGVPDHLGYETLARLKLPGRDYLDTLRALHLTLETKLYVEIGIRTGASLAMAGNDARCIAIDPQPRVNIGEWPNRNVSWNITTSDRFFERDESAKATGFDLAFIDGEHSFDQALRDFEHLEEMAGLHSVIAIHDVIPMDERTSTPVAQTSFHTGDVWRLMAAIVGRRPDLTAFTIACPPSGLGIVAQFREPLGVHRHTGEIARFPWTSWDEQEQLLNIVPNDPASIVAAFSGEYALPRTQWNGEGLRL